MWTQEGLRNQVSQKATGERELATASEWALEKLGFQADEAQRRLLDSTSKRVILNCSRQWGKSTVTAAKSSSAGWECG
jgi:hypothetical protein